MTATAARGCKAESLGVRGRAQVFRTSLRLLMLVPGALQVCIECGQFRLFATRAQSRASEPSGNGSWLGARLHA